MSANSKKLSAAQIKKIELLAEQAKCLPGMLLATPLVSADLVIGMLIACQNFAEDIDRALNDILKVNAK